MFQAPFAICAGVEPATEYPTTGSICCCSRSPVGGRKLPPDLGKNVPLARFLNPRSLSPAPGIIRTRQRASPFTICAGVEPATEYPTMGIVCCCSRSPVGGRKLPPDLAENAVRFPGKGKAHTRLSSSLVLHLLLVIPAQAGIHRRR
jgi:hypothetical protein